ncbi:hypothetical protein [Aeropyrum camini]|uniref:Copper resistance protein D domain-containing protein n=1 Tax=Aeropyrum camini SY1 = JCM 12091 TaxID=1198449 RepID=U3TB73_9CREN|nr:hypothetical protein [Aeropyrum camini]BAN90792.1 hypothetical protein ACAM_1323 [Aeropyrum camini SY1 = JCM 12091]
MTVLLILHYLHLLLASIWIGFLVAALVASFRGRDQVLAVQKTLGPAAMGSLLLLAIVGIGIALAKYDAGPGDWFQFGTHIGRIGEKIVSWIVAAATGFYMVHVAGKRLAEGESGLGGYRASAFLALLASLGAALLGSMLTLGV